jgi:ATP/ADP translocase
MWRLVRREEWAVAGPLSLIYFLVIAGFTLGKIARDGLFLAELPAQYLPYVYIALAGLSALVVGLLAKVSPAGAPHQKLAVGLLVTAASLVLFSLWFQVAGSQAAVPFYLWSGVYGLTLVSMFWVLVSRRVDPRQAKRLFGVIGAAGILGGLVAGATVSLVAEAIHPRWFLVVAAGLFAGAATLAARSAVPPAEAAVAPDAAEEADRAPGGFLAGGYVRLLVALFLVGGMTSGVLDYAFKLVLQQQYADQITTLLGAFYGVQNVVALSAQLGVAGFVFARFGNRVGATTLAGGVLAGGLSTLVLPAGMAGAAVAGSKLFDATMRASLARSSWEFLYFPLPEAVKARVKGFIDVVVSRGSEAAAGLLVLLLNFLLGGSIGQLAVLIAVLAGGWLVLEVAASRAYGAEVGRSLGRLVGDREPRKPTLAEISGPEELSAFLRSPVAEEALYALDVLESVDPGAIRANAEVLLRHSAAAVRARALSALIALGEDGGSYEEPLAAPLTTIDEAVVERGRQETAAERVAEAAAATRLTPPEARRTRLRELMSDRALEVRRVAYRSAALSTDRELLPGLIRCLECPEDRGYVRQALVLWGERIVGALGDYLADPLTAAPVRHELIAVLQEIGEQEAVHSLYRACGPEEGSSVANRALQAINRLQERHPTIAFPQETVTQHLGAEILRYCRKLAQGEAVRSAADPELEKLMERVLSERAEQSLERIFRRLALVHDPRRSLLACYGVVSGNPRLRAEALEYLDTTLPSELRPQIVPLLEAASPEERLRAATQLLGREVPSLEQLLAELLESPESWLNACGLFVIGSLRLGDRHAQPQAFLKSGDPIVSDTARWALGRLGGTEAA